MRTDEETCEGNRPEVGRATQLAMFGGGSYWAMRLLINIYSQGPSAVVSTPTFWTMALLELALILAALLCAKRLRGQTIARALAWCVAIGFVVDVALSFTPLSTFAASATVAAVFNKLGQTSTLLLWGLCFTTLERHAAERTTIASLGFALTVYLVALILPLGEAVVELVSYALVVASVLPVLSGRFRFDAQRREGPPNKSVLQPFYGSRVFFGACYGVCSFLCSCTLVSYDGFARPVALAVLVAVVVFIVQQLRTSSTNLTILRLGPAVACGIIACPLMGACDIEVVVLVFAPICIWMAWSVLHAVQLSTIKHYSGLDDVALAFSEKCVFVAAFAACAIVLAAVPGLADVVAAHPQQQVAAVVVVAFSAVMVCCYQLLRIVDSKEAERIVGDTNALHEQRFEPVYEKMAANFGLTARELEVMRLLAKNRGRAGVCEELCISDGTYRTHVRHIYKKLDVHSHDELLDLVERCAQEYVAQ